MLTADAVPVSEGLLIVAVGMVNPDGRVEANDGTPLALVASTLLVAVLSPATAVPVVA